MLASFPGSDCPQKVVVVQVSDLHFGRHFQERLARELTTSIERCNPSAIVVAGDLTMRARAGQFRKARNYLLQFDMPRLIVPGNHDVPLYNLVARTLFPFRNYDRFIADLAENPIDLGPVTLLGINTVNPWMHQRGRITADQLERIREWCNASPRCAWRVLVVHQHLFQSPVHRRPGWFRNGENLVRALSDMGVQAVMGGHLHYPYVVPARNHVPSLDSPVALIHSGTPTSKRTRASSRSSNSFNLLEFTDNTLTVIPHEWNPATDAFLPKTPIRFERDIPGESSATGTVQEN